MSTSNDNRSPLKARPLRQAGQSLNEQLDKLLSEDLAAYIFGAGIAVFIAALEWWRYLTGAPPSPVAFTIFAIAAVAFSFWKIAQIRARARLLRQGRDGERAVGEILDEMREQGFHVFHDIPGDGFNVDHALVGPRGVFTIETKTMSKPARGEAKITFDGEQVVVAGFKLDRNCVTQARAQAHWLRDLILESTGRKMPVRPVVVFPGWFIDPPPIGVKPDVWVLNPKALPAFVEREKETLTPEDVNLISYHLKRFVRAAVER